MQWPVGLLPDGQFFPYELWGDAYGQRIIPENVGNVQPFLSEQVSATRSVDDMLATMRRNSVLRDSWASMFLHALLLGTKPEGGLAQSPGDTSELERLLAGAKALGYEFVDLAAWTQANLRAKPPPAIEIYPDSAPAGPAPLLDGTEDDAVHTKVPGTFAVPFASSAD